MPSRQSNCGQLYQFWSRVCAALPDAGKPAAGPVVGNSWRSRFWMAKLTLGGVLQGSLASGASLSSYFLRCHSWASAAAWKSPWPISIRSPGSSSPAVNLTASCLCRAL